MTYPMSGSWVEHVVAFVVATTPRAGKTTFASWLAPSLRTTVGSTSSAAAESLERRLGLALGTIPAARADNPEAYRAELGEEGRLMHTRGTPPGLVLLQRGHRVIEGVRRLDELETARFAAAQMGYVGLVVCLRRPGHAAGDNTESSPLLEAADHVVDNTGDLRWLRRQFDDVLVLARDYVVARLNR